SADQGRAAESHGAADRMRVQYPVPDRKPGMPGDYSPAGRKTAGTLCRLHQDLAADHNEGDFTGGNAMTTTTRRTALKQICGAFALGMGGLHWDMAKSHAQAAKRGGTLTFAISAETPHY